MFLFVILSLVPLYVLLFIIHTTVAPVTVSRCCGGDDGGGAVVGVIKTVVVFLGIMWLVLCSHPLCFVWRWWW